MPCFSASGTIDAATGAATEPDSTRAPRVAYVDRFAVVGTMSSARSRGVLRAGFIETDALRDVRFDAVNAKLRGTAGERAERERVAVTVPFVSR
jgi:hypothetical protein